jgi:CubicO group peptidase (beta-lactamase class C family)
LGTSRTVLASAALVFAAAAAGDAAARSAAPDFAAIDRYVDAERREMHIPGLALGIVGGTGDVVHVAGFGAADAAGRPVSADTPFLLGSISKSFTALAVMQLVEAGRLALDAPVQTYLPWFRLADADAAARITVRHLLNQTSRLSTTAGRRTLTDFSNADDALEQRVRRLRDVAPTAPVGTTYQYSNCNYQVLGLLVEQAAGESYESYVERAIFAPLGMHRTYTSKARALDAGLATGHRAIFDRPIAFDEPLPRASIPQGFIISTARDMTRYLAAQMNGGRLGNVAVLSAAGVETMHRGVAQEGDGPSRYAMGWNGGRLDDGNAIWHAGDTFSFKSTMVVLTDERWGVVVLANRNDIPANQRVDELTFDVARLLTGRPARAEHANDSRWVHGVFVGGFLLQLLGMTRTWWLTRRWRAEPARRPRGGSAWALRVVLPATTNLLWGLLVLAWVPVVAAPLDVLWMAVPDVGRLLIASGAIALVWSIVRTLLASRALRARDGALHDGV